MKPKNMYGHKCYDTIARVSYPNHDIMDDGQCMYCHAWFVQGEDEEWNEAIEFASEEARNEAM